jgi:hypothetical protein
MRSQARTISTFLVAAILELGCQNKHPNFIPPPAPQPQTTAAPGPAELPQPPDVQVEPNQPAAALPAPSPEIPPPPAPSSPQPRSRRTTPQDTRTQAPAEIAQPAQPAEPARLGTLTTPEQERSLNAQVDQALNNAEANLRSLQNRSLTKEQENARVQVESFMRQAKERRASDLSGARSLAQRAEILARDLAASLR